MPQEIILASGSSIRSDLLRAAGVAHRIDVPRIDEESVRAALAAEQAPPRDVADMLAEMKARKISDRNPGALVLGCDQVLSIDREIIGKPTDVDDARAQLRRLRGKTHMLLSAAVLYEDSAPLWRHVGIARLHMRDISDAYLDDYLSRNWDSIRHSVGGYKLEEEGVRLFTHIQGDHFTILGLPLFELLNHLILKGTLPS
ncbi:Maf family protein [Puniceibacterium sediminis]|uniref:Nucleoside triphosphate pyrophosphatase n=1 Tax=Puniceibacterium sediminis TaxID=1608407 RepID=A0A238VRG0_9RHOB|nr:Maf family nucleotide pyrophosphatase [Puniceibacterium sediminis]SNR36942.1 septum formation protein [Puniceibacterium sediminis]